MALSGNFLFVIFKKESGRVDDCLLSLLVNELLFFAAPLGGASPPRSKKAHHVFTSAVTQRVWG